MPEQIWPAVSGLKPGLARRAAAYIPSIVLERPIYLRETADGLFRPVIYLTHKILEETVLSVVMALVFSRLVYIIVDLAVRAHFHLTRDSALKL